MTLGDRLNFPRPSLLRPFVSSYAARTRISGNALRSPILIGRKTSTRYPRYRFVSIDIDSREKNWIASRREMTLQFFNLSPRRRKLKSLFLQTEGFVIPFHVSITRSKVYTERRGTRDATDIEPPAVPKTSIPLINILLNPTPSSITYVRHAVQFLLTKEPEARALRPCHVYDAVAQRQRIRVQ